MHKLCAFIDSTYDSIAEYHSYDDSVKVVCELLSRIVSAAALVFVASAEAGTVASAFNSGTQVLSNLLRDGKPSSDFILKAKAIRQVMLNIPISDMTKEYSDLDGFTLVVPITAGAQRLGTLAVMRETEFSPEELIISQAAAVIMAANLKALKNEREASNLKDAAAVRAAIGTLSYSELEAASEVFRRLSTDEGSIIAARVASESKATRSAIVNALRKLESAGLLESHSMGVKGTFIKVHTPILREELKKFDQ